MWLDIEVNKENLKWTLAGASLGFYLSNCCPGDCYVMDKEVEFHYHSIKALEKASLNIREASISPCSPFSEVLFHVLSMAALLLVLPWNGWEIVHVWACVYNSQNGRVTGTQHCNIQVGDKTRCWLKISAARSAPFCHTCFFRSAPFHPPFWLRNNRDLETEAEATFCHCASYNTTA